MRSKPFIGLVLIAVIVLAAGCAGCRVRNSLATQQEEVSRAWADVQSQYQRRANLIPNLVETVRHAESFDQSVIESVTNAQERVRSASAGTLAPNDAGGYFEAQGRLGSSLRDLLDESRNTPQLASAEAFRTLQDQLEGTENRINVAHRDYNEAVAAYNSKVRRFPTNVVALLTGFRTMTPFEAQTGAENAPDVIL